HEFRVKGRLNDKVMFEVDWSFGNAYVSLYNERYPCASQRVASTKNRKGLLVVHVVRKDTLKPYIGKATMLADGGQAAFKVLLKYIEKPNGSDSHVLFIAAMAVGFFCISAIAVTAHIILNRVSLSQEKEVNITETHDVGVSASSPQHGL
uniref:Uncharacterized protein n=2 Tax=Parascaris univalens TaxID=6257 RepID=A0A915A319_PARUN